MLLIDTPVQAKGFSQDLTISEVLALTAALATETSKIYVMVQQIRPAALRAVVVTQSQFGGRVLHLPAFNPQRQPVSKICEGLLDALHTPEDEAK